MKASFLFPGFLAATQFLISVGAAEPSAPTESARDAEIIKRYDTNKNGKLDEAELASVKEQTLMAGQEKREEKRERLTDRKETWLQEFDKNGDGNLDDTEKVAMQATLRARAQKNPRMLKRLDTDGDGKLSDAEWAEAREKLRNRLMEGKEAK